MTTRQDLPAAGLWDDEEPRSPGTLVSAARFVPGLTADDVLAAGAGRERFFWRPPTGPSLAGFGVAAEIFGYGTARMQEIADQSRAIFTDAAPDPLAPPHARPRFFGGFAFRDDFVPDEAWSAFHPAHFLLPHVQFVQNADGRGGWLTISALAATGDDIADTRQALYTALDAHAALIPTHPTQPSVQDVPHPHPTEVRYPMDLAAWSDFVSRALGEIAAGRITKVVLARACELRSADGFDLTQVMAQLDAEYPECYRFFFEPHPGHAFLGATPELLVQAHGRDLHTMALAGSQARGATPERDAVLAAELLSSDKDRREHRLVLDALIERLKPLAATLTPGATGIMPLRNIQHLHTPVQAELHSAAAAISAIETLHPTPALGGAPRDAALRFIYEHEPLTRGWYAAPVGWFDAALDGAFCVAIRSAVVQKSRAWLYAGCGIVAGSIPQREWDETGLKFRPMLRALGGDSPRPENS